MRAFIFAIGLLFSVVPGVRAADDAGSAQAVISSQLEAIGRGDAVVAYSYAAPAIQGLFTRPDIFMNMVRQNYAPLVRPKRVEFGKSVGSDGKIAQHVHIVDSDGVAWEALYTLEQQPDGTIKITGCSLLKADQEA
ncbi:DUF4864 domain-containing protein [Afipia broomeae]|uniref:DUF4864 domain-containing protein n=1 Tax=Afipia broomeae ATCC 49717 TaxID=883078 RepID=K8PES2_9BRAD|nr:DUF4864 domain-containing protein [Afipia broomeae]EKS41142.1 hypothetical protein HMPREF9695_00234 [Afipia broomeae ATCC 49717]